MKYCISGCVFAVAALAAVSLFALEIQVAPQTLVISSGGGKLTAHTDVPFTAADKVELKVNGTGLDISTFPDSQGYLVAQCTKAAVVEIVGDFQGKTANATVTLIVDGDSASEVIRVKQ